MGPYDTLECFMGFASIIVETHVVQSGKRRSGDNGVALGALVGQGGIGFGREYISLAVLYQSKLSCRNLRSK